MKKFALYSIDTNLLKEYADLEKLNPKNWNINEYLNLKYDINAALAFGKLYFPDFFEKDGCIILSNKIQ